MNHENTGRASATHTSVRMTLPLPVFACREQGRPIFSRANNATACSLPASKLSPKEWDDES